MIEETTTTSGQDLHDIANQSWNSRRSEFTGIYFHISVNQAAKQEVADKHTKRKARREEASKTVTQIFHQAMASTPETLDAVATDKPDGEALKSFASDVAGKLTETESGTFGVLDPATIIAFVMSIIQGIISLRNQCKPPTPTPTPAPTT